MKNFLIALLVFFIWSFFGLWLYSWLQPNNPFSTHSARVDVELENIPFEKNNTDSLLEESFSENNLKVDSLDLVENFEENLEPVAISEGLKATTPAGDIIFFYPQGIAIVKNMISLKVPPSIKDFKYKLQTYLLENPDEEVHISSLYSASENIETPNLGYQRGLEAKYILTIIGIPSEKIVIKPIIREIPFNEEDVFDFGINFSFHPLDMERVEALKKALPESTVIYPEMVNNELFVNKVLEDLLTDVKTAISRNPDLEIEVVGHTDNVGNANDNYLVALRHARQLRWYLINKGGLDRKKVKATSRGESEAIAGNNTERGRALNRRIEIKYHLN